MSFLVDNDGVNPPKITEIPDPIPTHADLVAAAEKARDQHQLTPTIAYGQRHEMVEDYLAILRLHLCTESDYLRPGTSNECTECVEDWPCPTVQIVADRLTAWGVL